MRRNIWTVLTTRSASSGEAIRNVSRQGYEYYHPKYREAPVRNVRRISPLFPGYLFVLVRASQDWRPLASTRDVRQIFMWGEKPAVLHVDEIERLRSLENDHGYVEPDFASPPVFATGDMVQAIRGIFKDQYGEFVGVADARGGHRVRVVFEMLRRSFQHEISAFDLARVA